jgi:hypothetical protein
LNEKRPSKKEAPFAFKIARRAMDSGHVEIGGKARATKKRSTLCLGFLRESEPAVRCRFAVSVAFFLANCQAIFAQRQKRGVRFGLLVQQKKRSTLYFSFLLVKRSIGCPNRDFDV